MISVGIIGGTGYTGKYLLEFCGKHPQIENITVYAKSSAGEELLDIFPELTGIIDNRIVQSVDKISTNHDVYFISLPHMESIKYVPWLFKLNKIIIDLGGDFRLKEPSLYDQWYNFAHTSPKLLSSALYGLTEFCSFEEGTKLVANPGCYPTSVLLALLPLTMNFADKISTVSVASYSGTSGAGKSPKQHLLMSEMDGNVAAYNVNKHRHQPEILQELKKSGMNSPFTFTTHLLPVSRGIYTTCSVHLKEKIDPEEAAEIYNQFYRDKKFVRMRNVPPNLTWVTGTNFCDINISGNQENLIITSAIDNLIKGASGQAVQNMNKIFGWDETTGIIN